MENAYNNPISAIKYLEFLGSNNGIIQQNILYKSILEQLPKDMHAYILDAGCGSGWLSGKLKEKYSNISAFDASEFLIKIAKVNHANINYKIASLEGSPPYPDSQFDVVILNMVLPDISNLPKVFENISKVLKPHGKFIATIPNPKYTFPKAEWKRNFINIIFGQKPELKINPAFIASGKIKREYNKNSFIDSYYYSLSDYISNAKNNGFEITKTIELKPEHESQVFDLNYQLSQYPLLQLLSFKKV